MASKPLDVITAEDEHCNTNELTKASLSTMTQQCLSFEWTET